MSCTTILVGKKASYDGSTIIARDDDSGSGRYDPKKFVVVAPQEQPRHYRSVLSHVEIDLPDNPCRYSIVPNVLPNRGILAEAGVNERNVAMSATETIAVNERVLAADPLVELRPAEGVPGEAGYRPETPGGIGEEAIAKAKLLSGIGTDSATRDKYMQAALRYSNAKMEYDASVREYETMGEPDAMLPTLDKLGTAMQLAKSDMEAFLDVGASSGFNSLYASYDLLRQKIVNSTTATGDGGAPLPPPGAPRSTGVVEIPAAIKVPKKAKAANYAAVDSFREETAQIARELSKRQELLENSNAALAGVDQRWYDARAVQAQEAYGASIIEEASRWQDAQARLQQQYASAYDAAAGNHELQMQLQMERYGARELLEQDHQSRLLQIENDRVNKQREYQATVAAELLTFTQQQMSITTSAMQQAGMEQSALYKVLFAAQKAAAIPSMIVATEDAATKALGAVPAPYSIPLAASVKALGYASIGVVAGQTLAGMFDKGGYIPANQFGIVSELGDEFVNGTLVRGPANVTSRRESAAILDRAAGRGQSGEGVTIIQHISVTGSGDEALANAMRSAAEQGAEAGAKRAYQMVVEDVSNYGQIRRVLG